MVEATLILLPPTEKAGICPAAPTEMPNWAKEPALGIVPTALFVVFMEPVNTVAVVEEFAVNATLPSTSQSPAVKDNAVTDKDEVVLKGIPEVAVWTPDWVPVVVILVPKMAFAIEVEISKVFVETFVVQ